MNNIDWPILLADLTAKRDALTDAIAVLTTHFVRDAPVTVPVRRAKTAKTAKTAKSAKSAKVAKVRTARTVRTAEDQPRAATAATGTATVASIEARDAAILSRLKKGPATASELRDAMPPEPTKSDGQRNSDVHNALTRLRLKKLVKQVDEGWALV